MSYQINPNEPSEQFLRLRNIAGATLQERFKEESGKFAAHLDYKWIKAELTWPSFDHLTFSFGNQVFSVLVSLGGERGSSLAEKERERCMEACERNNLIPCVFEFEAESGRPRMSGWNLLHLITGEPIIPSKVITDERIPMSEWELRNFCIQIVREQLSNDGGGTVLSYCDLIGIDPQIWFDSSSGNRGWIVVRFFPVIAGNEKNQWIGHEKSNPQLQQFDGYFAAVSVASSEPVLYDLEGNVVPLSERFSGNAPLYRGDGFHVKFDGLQRIFVS